MKNYLKSKDFSDTVATVLAGVSFAVAMFARAQGAI